MNTKTLFVSLAGGVVIAGALAWAFRPPPIPVDLAPIARGPLVVTIDEEGRTRIRERYVVSTPLAGRLLRVSLRPGDKVEAGHTVIAVIEPATPELLDPRSRALAEAKVKAAEAAQQRSAQMLERARTSHEYAATELQRAQALYERAGVSHRELDAAEQREAETAAELRSAEFESRVAAYEFEMARAAFVGEDPETADLAGARRMEIPAPISGRVLRVFQESATVVPAGARLVEVGEPSDLEVVIEALSTDAVKIAAGARVMIEHWGGSEPLAARVRVVEPAGFTKVSALGVEEQRVNVIADFTGAVASRSRVGDGFRVEARIVTWESNDVLLAPVGTLFRAGESWAVFVNANGRAQLREVRVGQRNNRSAEIVGGLQAGENVILHPGDRIADGTRVKRR